MLQQAAWQVSPRRRMCSRSMQYVPTQQARFRYVSRTQHYTGGLSSLNGKLPLPAVLEVEMDDGLAAVLGE